ncbi:hypothetical protein MRO13_05255 [Vibrio metschnikovii]|uniref:hypothetical protein n=1 Tax=Gammaproteobacteria TaxID=1236 RepID=UPI0006D9AB68|nr:MULTISPECIES: hypothetical protein [Alteromonadales]KPN77861.1 hypothetical protein AEA42_06105 [Shewanella sp. Sh95]
MAVMGLNSRQWPEAAMIMVLFTIAELIEAKSLDRARNAIGSLMNEFDSQNCNGPTISMNDDTLRLPSPEQRHGQHIAYDDDLVKAMVQWVDNFLNTR